jgi:GT2 family glycosyltransferase
MIKLGLVTVLYNSVDVLEGFFKSLAAQTCKSWHLEVIDNSPDDASMLRAKQLAKIHGIEDVHFVKNPGNFGVAKGNNQGIENCLALNCDYVILLNNDIEFADASLFEKIASEIDQHGYEILVPKVYYFDTGKLWYAGGLIEEFSGKVKHFGDGEDDAPKYSTDCFTGYAPTCFMAIKANIFKSVGLMDERYFVYSDDTDFVLRCLRANIKLRYLGNLSLRHKVSSSTGGDDSDFSIYYGNRNRLFFIRKNLTGYIRASAIVLFCFTRVIRWFFYSGNKKNILYKAVMDGLRLK